MANIIMFVEKFFSVSFHTIEFYAVRNFVQFRHRQVSTRPHVLRKSAESMTRKMRSESKTLNKLLVRNLD